MTSPEKKNEEEVFLQSADDDELSGVAGGSRGVQPTDGPLPWWDDDYKNCTKYHSRNIYGGNGFPNCAASVEDGSWCGTNDACALMAIVYDHKEDCQKAWK